MTLSLFLFLFLFLARNVTYLGIGRVFLEGKTTYLPTYIQKGS